MKCEQQFYFLTILKILNLFGGNKGFHFLDNRKMLSIAMVSDYFAPSIGGVETHIMQLSRQLVAMGHRVIVLTTTESPRHLETGLISYPIGPFVQEADLNNDLERTDGVDCCPTIPTYYLGFPKMYKDASWPVFYGALPWFAKIIRRHQVQIVHGHQALSPLAHECLCHARVLGLATVMTDHSLFGFADGSSLCTNQWLAMTLSDVDRVICVSHCRYIVALNIV